jgi:hypothetical protein
MTAGEANAVDDSTSDVVEAETSSPAGRILKDAAWVSGGTAAAAGEAAAAMQEAAAVAAAGGVLQGIVQEVWADTDVAAAFQDLKPAPVLTFEQLKQRHMFEQQKLSVRQKQGTDQRPVSVISGGPATAPLLPLPPGDSSRTSPNGVSGAPGSAAQPELQHQHKQEDTQSALQRPDVLGFVDYVIDNALLGMVQEGL